MNATSMKIVVTILFFLSLACCGFSQNLAFELISKFKQLKLPVNDISNIATCDSLDNVWLNNYLFPREGKKIIIPKIINSEGDLKRHNYTGRYPEKDQTIGYYYKEKDGSFVERKHKFHNRIDAIGQVQLAEKYILLVLRVESVENIIYDAWSVDKLTLVPHSQVCLFYGYKKAWNDPTIEYIEVDSEITQDGFIIWHSNQRGLHTYITWKVDEETGFFKIMSERQEGTFDY